LTARELEDLWFDLAARDGRKGHRALARLAAFPAQAVGLVRKRLQPSTAKPPDQRQIAAWIADLDADSFETREKASRVLGEAGPHARAAVLAALEAGPAPEKKRRLEEVRDRMDRAGPSLEMLRPTRALELLERLGTPEARKLVEELAGGSPGARLTLDARATLRRLAR
jgi:hypothetical protein